MLVVLRFSPSSHSQTDAPMKKDGRIPHAHTACTRFLPRLHPRNDPREEIEIWISHSRMLVVLCFIPRLHSQTDESGESHTITQLALAFFLVCIHKTTHAKRWRISHCRMLVVLRFFPRSHSQTGTLMKIQHPVSASCSLHPCSSVPVCMSARFGASQDKLSCNVKPLSLPMNCLTGSHTIT